MARKIKASDYTHSVWSGKKYDRPQTDAELLAESKAVIARNPALAALRERMRSYTAADIAAMCAPKAREQ